MQSLRNLGLCGFVCVALAGCVETPTLTPADASFDGHGFGPGHATIQAPSAPSYGHMLGSGARDGSSDESTAADASLETTAVDTTTSTARGGHMLGSGA